MQKQHYDLIAIGAGSGGLAVAEKAAQAGKKVAVIEAGKIGGTCVNNGCVPKKVMWYAANITHSIDDAASFGIPARREKTNWLKLVSARQQYIKDINSYWSDYVLSEGIDHIQGYARFTAKDTLQVNGQSYSADHIVIATGGKPIVPPIPGAELGITSDDFFSLTRQPEKVAVIGGGYIGVELSGVLQALGSQVTLFALEDRVLENFDNSISSALADEMIKQGIRLNTGFAVNALTSDGPNIRVTSSNQETLTDFDQVIWAVGRRPNTDNLNLASAGVRVKDNGIIVVDEYQNTNIPGIYAIGDVIGKAALTPVAIAAGRKLADRLFNGKSRLSMDYENIPSVVFSHPPVSTIGLTEANARKRYGDDLTVYQSDFTPMRHALTPHDTKTAMKLICKGKNQQIIGIHILGENADEMMQGFAVALKMGATKADLDNTVAIHPSSAEELVTMKHPVPRNKEHHSLDNGLEWQQAS